MELSVWNQALEHLLKDEALPKAYGRYIRYVMKMPADGRDPYEEALSLMHLDEEQPLPSAVCELLRSFFLSQRSQDARAWNDLGVLYYMERSPIHNLRKAFECFLEGEKAGSLDAVLNIGFFYRYDQGERQPLDEKKAWSCFAKTALFGIAQGTLQLAIMLEKGIGFPADWHCALGLYETLISQISDPAEDALLYVQSVLGAARILITHEDAQSEYDPVLLLEDVLAFAQEYHLYGREESIDRQLDDAQRSLDALLNLAPESLH